MENVIISKGRFFYTDGRNNFMIVQKITYNGPVSFAMVYELFVFVIISIWQKLK